ncbi:hypothetical protein H0E87_007580 [Populus deltoides]|uniref:DYW domain-containing protein n=1 Tax=Populus deltoides TaxID=3696 RepID=A0A8T2ZBY9_POPDE|nr:hypothetical protein H0E87_007580 [Populus deltoides]
MQLRTRLSLEYCTVLLESCIQSKSLFRGKLIHQHLLKCLHRTHETNLTNFDVPFEKLVDLYIACGELKIARHVFDKMPHRPKNVVLWNLLIRAYAWNGPYEEAIDLYYKMLGYGIPPNRFTFPFVLKACSALKEASEGREIHCDIKRLRLESNVYVSTALVDFYAKCGCLDDAKEVFDKMHKRDVVAWNSMISGFSLHEGSYDEVARLLVQMQNDVSPNSSTIVGVLPAVAQVNSLRHGKEIHGFCIRRGFVGDVVVGTGILDVYGKCQCIDYARRIFDMMGIVKNEVTWSAMVGAYVVCDFMREALELFCQLLMLKDDGIVLSAVTLATVIRVCANLTDLSMGSCLHCYAIKSGFVLDLMVGNTLLSMYAKCGIINGAMRFFNEMDLRDAVSFTAIISGYVQNGNSEEGLRMFLKMQLSGIIPEKATMASVLPACAHLAALHYGSCSHCYAISDGLKPDDVTFICLISACSHSGLVAEGNYWFNAMTQDFGIIPRMEHYACMVDLLSRAGLFKEVHSFIEKMPLEPDIRVWSALLSACRVYKNVELGEGVSKKIQKLGPESTGNFVLLSNMYSAVGRWDDAAQVRITQKEQGFEKSPGCSWIEISGVVHTFVGGGYRSHPQLAQISNKLDELLVEMKRLGYQAESSYVFQDVEEEEKERVLLYHSEKLAIAFGILSLSPDKPILVTKNLRVCGDCHTAIKFISLVTRRDITVRDASRFHHFKDGICNCGDFW